MDFDFDFKTSKIKSYCGRLLGGRSELVCEQVYRADWENSLVKKTIRNNQSNDDVDFCVEKKTLKLRSKPNKSTFDNPFFY